MPVNDLFSLKGKNVLITGGTGVLGQVMVQGLVEAGAAVAILGRRLDAGQALARRINESGGRAIALQADVLDREQLNRARQVFNSELGTIDILINAAGGNLPGAIVPPDRNFFDLKLDDFQKVVDLNLMGSVLPTQVFAVDMAAQKKGVIINIASMAAFKPITRVGGYSAAKAAIANFTTWLAVEMVKKYGEGIRVNALSPGFFLTEQNRALLTNADGSYTARGQAAIHQTPYGRLGHPEELIGTLIWLCSDASAFVTGINVPVDGGFTAFCGV
jgi:NAD(P)-dependent dehydrogenase (short-subunit alcohol dehydrogenase family)